MKLLCRVILIGSVASLAIAPGLAAAKDPPPATVTLHIAAQSVGDALSEFAKQSGLQVVLYTEVAQGLVAPALEGTFTSLEALGRILAGTNLEYEFINPHTVAVRKKAGAAGQAGPPSTSRLAPAHESAATLLEGGSPPAAPAPPRSVEPDAGMKTKSQSRESILEEVVITGSRIPEIPGQSVQPVRRYSRQDIERSGETTLTEFLNRLPDVSVSGSETIVASNSSFTGQTTVQLHGLPVGTTLVLLNGRRVEGNDSGFFDLGNIPASAIERIEVLPVGASAIYGSDALGGAVNIALRSDIDGFEASGKFGHAAGLSDSDATFAWGAHRDHGSVSLIGTYQDRGELLGGQRAATTTTTSPGPTQAFWIADFCFPGTVYSLDGSNLPSLSSPVAGIPKGVTGTPTIPQFVPTAGKVNLCNDYQYHDVIPSTQREGLMIAAHQKVAESVDLFSEVLLTHYDWRFDSGPMLAGSGVPPFGSVIDAANPYNPFGQTVGVSFAFPNALDSILRNSSTFVRPLVGVRGSLFADWHYEATAYLSRNRFQLDQPTLDYTALQTALNSSNPASALNPFTSGTPGSSQLLQSLLSSPTAGFEVSRIVGAQGFVRGPVAHLPAGPLQTVFGVEYSREDLHEGVQSYGLLTNLDLHRVNYSMFTEARVPLLAGTVQTGADSRLNLTLAGRYDHSNDYGGKATWQGGLAWRATSTLLLRGGYGTSYKAPLLTQIDAGLQFSSVDASGLFGLVDPFRGGQSVISETVSFGSNPNLKPETGDAITLGMVYSSDTLRGLEASLSYFSVHIANYIFAPLDQALIDNPTAFPGAVIRNPPTPQDQQQGFLGQIIAVNDSYFNFGDLRVKGFDADVKYAIDTAWGQVTPSLALATIYRWDAAITPGSPTVSYLSQATLYGPGFAPRWKGTAALDWHRGPLSINLAGRYIGRYWDYQEFLPNTNELGNFWIADLNSRYDIGAALFNDGRRLGGTYVAVGAVNLLNRQPQLSYGVPYDPFEADIRGRFVYGRIGVKW